MPAAGPGNAAFHALVTGRVQGVGFRFSAVRQARVLGLFGTVANRSDGSVEVEAEGELPDLERLLAWLRRGPPGAHVRDVQVEWLPWSGRFRGFEVEF
ncbi:MAG: acylphosphatase [Spirochaetia bacterium]